MKRQRSTDFRPGLSSLFNFELQSDLPLCSLPLTLLFDSSLVQSRLTVNRLLAIAFSICSILACRCIYHRDGHVGLVQGVVQVEHRSMEFYMGAPGRHLSDTVEDNTETTFLYLNRHHESSCKKTKLYPESLARTSKRDQIRDGNSFSDIHRGYSGAIP